MWRNLLRSPPQAITAQSLDISAAADDLLPIAPFSGAGEKADARAVTLWIIKLSSGGGASEASGFTELLAPIEKARLIKLVSPTQRERFAYAHAALRYILSIRVNAPPQTLTIITSEGGKPVLADRSIGFNLSHSGDTAAVAVADGLELGVDVEKHRPLPELEGLIALACTARERACLDQAAGLIERRDLFFVFWTRKEAALKATGLGVRIPLKELETSAGPWVRVREPDGERAVFVETLVQSDATLAVACVGRAINATVRAFAWAQPALGAAA